jgi:hypothetical protein
MLSPAQASVNGAVPFEKWGSESEGDLLTWKEPISSGTILSAERKQILEETKCLCKTFDRRRGNRGRELQVTGRAGNLEAGKAVAYI